MNANNLLVGPLISKCPSWDSTSCHLARDILFVLTECVKGYFFLRLLSRPENWLTEEHARVQIWENVLSKCETDLNASFVFLSKGQDVFEHTDGFDWSMLFNWINNLARLSQLRLSVINLLWIVSNSEAVIKIPIITNKSKVILWSVFQLCNIHSVFPKSWLCFIETFVFQRCRHLCVFSFFVRAFQVTCMKNELKTNL